LVDIEFALKIKQFQIKKRNNVTRQFVKQILLVEADRLSVNPLPYKEKVIRGFLSTICDNWL